MKQESKHRSQEHQSTASASAQGANTREFASVEELLRHDAAQTPVPPIIAERLTKSIRDLPRPSRTWWERFLKR